MLTNIITLHDVANSFGCTIHELHNDVVDYYNSLDMSFTPIEGLEKEELLLEILKKIDSDKQQIGADERTNVWFEGWKENLDAFRKEKTFESIVPKFIRPNNPIRFNGKYIRPNNPTFERDYSTMIQLHVYHTHIPTDVKNVYEFGCGSRFNLFNLVKVRNDVNIFASDFVQSSADLMNEIADHFGYKIKGDVFNIIEPNYSYTIKPNSCVFTSGAIEQVASKCKNFINYIIHNNPKVCFHIEPTVEFYNDDTLFDYLAIKFHKKRGYTQGLVPYLKQLEKENKIEIDVLHRFNFGSLFMEGFNLIVWRPKVGS
ncbi:MAG TPA: hypothetical protein DCM40_16455 [Maribacter sp.]|nr:hypothetical protein [Maribacter sp.]